MTALYRIRELSFSYSMGAQRVPALRALSCDIDRGTFTALAGPSGSGKSTLLHLMGLIEAAPVGQLWLDGEDLGGLTEARKNHLRRFRLGFVFQAFHLFPNLSAQENVAFFVARQSVPRRTRAVRVEAALRAVGLWELRHHTPLRLSGGQRQRVAIARALAKAPAVLIADEPTASLDQQTGRDVMEILHRLNREHGVTVVVASHDPMVLAGAPRCLHLTDGAIRHAA
jgi:putative ABC transport system ATP-binding protein